MDALDVLGLRGGIDSLGERASAAMDLLRKGGVLLLIEPPVPGEDISDSTEEGAAVIAGFNAWISFNLCKWDFSTNSTLVESSCNVSVSDVNFITAAIVFESKIDICLPRWILRNHQVER